MMKAVSWPWTFIFVLTMACCTPDTDCGRSSGSVNVEVFPEIESTKTSGTDSNEWESKVCSVDYLVFEAEGGRMVLHSRKTSSSKATLSLKTGQYSIWAVVNAPDILDGIADEQHLRQVGLWLGEKDGMMYNSIEGGMVQANSSGGVSISVLPLKSVTVNIKVKRFVSRVILAEVTNGLPPSCGNLRIEKVFLSNVSGYRTVGSTSNPKGAWYNRMGRSDGIESHVIDGEKYAAESSELTYSSLGKDLASGEGYRPGKSFYSYQNSTSSNNAGWSAVWSERQTRLVVVASYGGTSYFYPVSIPELKRNNTYDVNLRIVGPGSSDPDIPVSKANLSVTVNVNGCSFLHSGSTSDCESL